MNSAKPTKEQRRRGGGGGKRLFKDLKRQANSLSRASEQASTLGCRRSPIPAQCLPTKTNFPAEKRWHKANPEKAIGMVGRGKARGHGAQLCRNSTQSNRSRRKFFRPINLIPEFPVPPRLYAATLPPLLLCRSAYSGGSQAQTLRCMCRMLCASVHERARGARPARCCHCCHTRTRSLPWPSSTAVA